MDPVTLIIPNRSEPMVGETVQRLKATLAGLPVTLLVVNDPDGTGIGATIRRGLADVETPWVGVVMADGSEDPESIWLMVQKCRRGVDAVWGTRWGPGSSVTGYPWIKRGLNRLGNQLIARLVWPAYTDWTDLAKLYRTAYLQELTWSEDFRAGIEIPIRYYRRWRPQISLGPMHWRERTAGTSAYRWRHAVLSLVALVRVLVWG